MMQFNVVHQIMVNIKKVIRFLIVCLGNMLMKNLEEKGVNILYGRRLNRK